MKKERLLIEVQLITRERNTFYIKGMVTAKTINWVRKEGISVRATNLKFPIVRDDKSNQ